MAIILECSYAKKLGLPGYSSHSYAATVRTEISDLSQLERTNAELYQVLQNAVDHEIQQPGFVPAETYGMNGGGNAAPSSEAWKCSPKQRDLILKLVEEREIPKEEVENLALKMFNVGTKVLNKLQASGLIDELMRLFPAKEGSRPLGRSNRPVYGGRR